MYERTRAVLLATLLVCSVVGAPVAVAGGTATSLSASGVASTEDGSLASSVADRPSSDRSAGPDPTLGDGLENETGQTEVVVRFTPAASLPAQSDRAQSELRDHAARTQGPFNGFAAERPGVTVRESFWLANAQLVVVDTDRVPLERLLETPHVERVHQNFEVQTLSASLAGTSRASAGSNAAPSSTVATSAGPTIGGDATDSGATTDGDAYTYGLELIDAPTAWEQYDQRGQNATVAVLDTGVDVDGHPELAPDGWAEFADNGSQLDTDPNDGNGHGTHASGTVLGDTTDDGTHYGVAPEAEFLHGKVLDDDGGGTFAAVIAGMEWGVDEGADAISMSLGADGYYSDFVEPTDNARASGAVVVASIGNNGEGTSGSPGNVYDATSVGAVDDDREVATFSGGETIDTDDAWGDDALDHWPETYLVPRVSAPGVSIYSADLDGTFSHKSGTSMAAPHVAGVVALLRSHRAQLDVGAVEDELATTADHPEGDDHDHRYGTGIVNASEALASVSSTVSGNVTAGTDGRAVDVATVTALEDGEVVAETRVDENGSYAFELDTSTEYTIAADAPAFHGANRTIATDDPDATSADLELDPEPGVVGGIVDDAAVEEPAPNVTVDLWDDAGDRLNRTATTADGTFEIGPLENGTYDLGVNDSAFEPTNRTVEVEDDDATTLLLAADPLPGAVQWTVRSAVTNETLSDGTVTLTNTSDDVVNETTTADALERTFEPVARDRAYELAASHDDYENRSVVLDVGPNETVDHDLLLDPLPGAIAGTVTDGDDETLAGATLELPGLGLDTSTDENGTYAFEDVPAEHTHDIAVDARAYWAQAVNVSVAANGSTEQHVTLDQRARYLGVDDLDAPTEVDEGQTVDVSATITNLGTDDWADEAVLEVDESVVATEAVSLNASNATTVAFEHEIDDAGTYQIGITTANETATKTVSVESSGGGGLVLPPSSDDGADEDAGEPSISVTDASVASSAVAVDEPVTVDVTLGNDGDADGSIDLALAADGQTVDSSTVSVVAGDTRSTTLSTSFEEPGSYDLAVNGEAAGTVTVGVQTTDDAEEATDDGEGPSDGTPGFGLLAAMLAVALAAGCLAVRRRP